MKTYFLLFGFLFITIISKAQHTSIYGKVTDEEYGEELIYANIVLEKKGVFAAGGTTDFEGNYSILLDPGTYDLKVSYTGYDEKVITGIVVEAGRATNVDIKMSQGVTMDCVVVTGYSAPLIDKDHTSSGATLRSAELSKLLRGKSAGLSSASGLAGSSEMVTIRGSRSGAVDYYVDGIRMSDSRLASRERPMSVLSESFLNGTEATFEYSDSYLSEPFESLIQEETPITPTAEEKKIQAGLLTASEWNPLKHWKYWKKLNKEKKDYENARTTWQVDPKNRYSVIVTNLNNIPVTNAQVHLIDEQGSIHWTAMTDNKGRAELWADLFASSSNQAFQIVAEYQTITSKVKKAKPRNKRKVNHLELNVSCQQLDQVDILFIVDATGSMGDEIAYLQAEMQSVIKSVKNKNTHLDINTGSVFYRDQGDAYLTAEFHLSDDLLAHSEFINKKGAGGGGDYPEAVHSALEAALQQKWRANAISRIAFLLLDAPPHENPEVLQSLQTSIRRAATQGIRLIPVTASGIDKSTEYLMKAMAIATNGSYVFITDHSGIGNAHLEPSVDDYQVEPLNDILIRLINQFSKRSDCLYSSNTPLIEETNIETAMALTINLYPNPTDGILNIELNQDVQELNIFHINGQLIRSIKNMELGKQTIDLSALAAGVYILRFNKGDEVVSKKLVITNKK